MTCKSPWLSVAVAAFAAGAALAAPGDRPEFPISVEAMEARMATRHAERLAVLDANDDGRVSPEEFAAAQPPRLDRRRGPRGRYDDARMRHGDHGPGDRAEMHDAVFAAADLDGDGKLSKEEFSGVREARRSVAQRSAFRRLDANGDGFLTAAEMPGPRASDLDADGDGQITREELRQRRPRHGPGPKFGPAE